MNWAKSISWTELIYILVFLCIYGYYFWRTGIIGKKIGKPSRIRLVKFLWRTVYFTLMIIALLGPGFGKTETEARTTSKDLLFAIDLSASMNTADVSPSRIEKVKLELFNLIDNLKANRIGIMVFSSEAYWQIPYTYDVALIRKYISALKPAMMPNSGTNLNAPLQLIHDKIESQKSDARNSLAVIITDGESFSPINSDLANSLVAKKAKIVLLAVGTEVGGLVQINNAPVEMEDGTYAHSKVNLEFLKKTADALKANLFLLQNDFSELSKVLVEIQSGENKIVNNRKLIVVNNKYRNFLLIALILAVLDFLITIKIFKI